MEAIGSLMYTLVATRPNITFAILTLSQFLDNLGEVHWDTVKHIFRYLVGTKDLQLMYGGERHNFLRYVDADGALQPHGMPSQGMCFSLTAGPYPQVPGSRNS